MKTNKQKVKELRDALDASLKQYNYLISSKEFSETANPKTKRSYKTDAEQLFTTLALIEQALRHNEASVAKIYAQGMLQELGFGLVDILTDKCLKDGVYNEN